LQKVKSDVFGLTGLQLIKNHALIYGGSQGDNEKRLTLTGNIHLLSLRKLLQAFAVSGNRK